MHKPFPPFYSASKKFMMLFLKFSTANIHLFEVNNINTRKKCEICAKLLTMKTPKRHFIVNFEICSGVFKINF